MLLMLLLGVSTLFIASLTSSARTTLRQELRAEGTYALDTLSFFIRNASTIDTTTCLSPGSSLRITSQDGGTTVFGLVGDQIASTSAHSANLTSDAYTVENFSLDCEINPAQNQPYVVISFNLKRTDSQGTEISNEFRHTVLMRNRN